MRTLEYEGRKIGDGHRPYIISEIGVNFGTFEDGKRLIDESVAAGADCVKIQTFKADSITTKDAVLDLPNVGKVSQYKVFKELELSDSLQRRLFKYARKKKVVFFSTPTDKRDVDFLEDVGMPIYKIGSDDATNLPFIEYVAKLGKPTIISTGMCNMSEVMEIRDVFSSNDNDKLSILHCVTKYPTEPEFVNLRAMDTMKRRLGIPVGYSDHSIGMDVCMAAVAAGANIIEKHVTLDKRQKGPDHVLSATPRELRRLVDFSHVAFASMGSGSKKPAECEVFTRRESRKSVTALRDIREGEKITKSMVRIMRPGHGIKPKDVKKVIGMRARLNLKRHQTLRWKDLE
ncbi:N-acylneuraminate-9-phosphate synthase [Nitrosopumilaceae archaeon]|nr:N-acylneuraminate-9-phosphate synthase [Nitrosopumilaceae archaeon]